MTQFPQKSDSKEEDVNIGVLNKFPLNACEHVLNLPSHFFLLPTLMKEKQQVLPPPVPFINVKKCLIAVLRFKDANFLLFFFIYLSFFL